MISQSTVHCGSSSRHKIASAVNDKAVPKKLVSSFSVGKNYIRSVSGKICRDQRLIQNISRCEERRSNAILLSKRRISICLFERYELEGSSNAPNPAPVFP